MRGGAQTGNKFTGEEAARGRVSGDAERNEDKYQALDNLQQLLHHYSDALVTKETADGLEVGRADEVSVGAVYVGVGDVQRLRRQKERERDKDGVTQDQKQNRQKI